MKYLVVLLPLILLMGCAKPDNSMVEWQKAQAKANLEYQQKYQALTDNLTVQLNQQKQQVAQLNTDKLNLQNQVNQLQYQLSIAPTQQQLAELRGQLAAVNSALGDMTQKQAQAQARVNALAASEFELNRKLNDSQAEYKDLTGRLLILSQHTDLTITTNMTTADQKIFNKGFDLWYKAWQDDK